MDQQYQQLDLNAAARRNNVGVRLLEEQRFEEACVCFRNILRDYAVAIQTSCEHPSMSCCQTRLQWSSSCGHFLGNGHNYPQHLHQETFIYERALFVEETTRRCKHAQQKNVLCTSECAAFVFNMGVALHLLGVTTNRSKHLKGAMECYKVAASIRNHKRLRASSSYHHHCGKVEMIDLALLNNMGQLHHEFVDYVAARQCFDQLTRGLLHLDERTTLDLVISKMDQKGFMKNLTILSPDAAAAA